MLKQVDVLVVDDDDFLRTALRASLESKSFSVEDVADGAAMHKMLESCAPSVVLLDLNMPDSRGLDLARELRRDPNIGIVILTGSDDEYDKIVSLEIGADDYIQKGVDPRELAARIRTVHRRVRMHSELDARKWPELESLCFADYVLNTGARTLGRSSGRIIDLTSHEYNLLEYFVSNPNRVLSRDQLMQRLSGRDWYPNDRSIDTLIVKLRRKIEKEPSSPRFIKTVRGLGYIFTERPIQN